jgi:hypothetical protein
MKLDVDAVRSSADLGRIASQYLQMKQQGRELVGLCPFHKEKSPSFTVDPEKGLWKCFGCDRGGDVFTFVKEIEGLAEFSEVVERVAEMSGADVPARYVTPQADVKPAPKPREVAVYRYEEEDGQPAYEIVRLEPGRDGKKKEFRQRYRAASGEMVWKKHPRQVLYRLPEVLVASQVFICEGEKDADRLCSFNVVATTNAGGCKAPWLPGYTQALAGKQVFIIPDNDDPGFLHASRIFHALQGVASEVLLVRLPIDKPGGDVSDFLDDGNTLDDLLGIIERLREAKTREELLEKGLLDAGETVSIMPGGEAAFLSPSLREKGLPTGFGLYDVMTLGLHRGELVVFAARPAMGKTAMVLNIATHVAEQDKRVTVFSLEMGRSAIFSRILCARARIDSQKFRHDKLNAEEIYRRNWAWQEIKTWALMVDDSSGMTVEKIKERAKRERSDLIIVDYLQLLVSEKSRREVNRTQEVGAFSRGLKMMARELNVPVIALCQLSRGVESRENKRPMMSDLRDSGEIEQDADVINFIFREEVYKADRSDLKGRAELIVAKHRNGPTGTIPLTWMASLTKFENLTNEREF